LQVASGTAGIWSAFGKAYQRAAQLRCLLHKMPNVLEKVPERIEDAGRNGAFRAVRNALEGGYSEAATRLRETRACLHTNASRTQYVAELARDEHHRVPSIPADGAPRSGGNYAAESRQPTLSLPSSSDPAIRWRRFNEHRIIDDAYKQVTTRWTGATTIAKKKAT